MLETLAARWHLELGPELPGGLLSCVRTVTREDGAEAVLKIGSRPGTRDEIAALENLERIGRTRAPRRRRGAAGPAARTHRAGQPSRRRPRRGSRRRLTPPARRAAARGAAARARRCEQRLEPRSETGGRRNRRRAGRARRSTELERGPAATVLLHGDLDERNLLVCRRRGLCAIDPLPCAGDPAYDAGYWVHGNRRPGRRARLEAIVAATGLERARVRDWAAVVGVHG